MDVALHLVGLGLYDVGDITVKGLALLRSCDVAYAEFYTAILCGSTHDDLENLAGREIRRLDRLGVETGAARLVEEARTREVVLLTAGDPMAATTHTDLVVRAHAAGVPCRIVHAPSIVSAAPGLLGLQHYKFGRITTIVRPEPGWNPTSPFETIEANLRAGLHTLVLLDIKTDEPSPHPGVAGWPERGYFMTAREALTALAETAQRTESKWVRPETPVGVVARAGSAEPGRWTGTLATLQGRDFGPPLHCLVIPGAMQVVEEEAWGLYEVGRESGS